MSIINIITVDSNNVNLEKDGKQIGSVKFEGFFKESITATTSGNRIYEFVQEGFWHDKFIFKQGEEIFIRGQFFAFGKMTIENLKDGKKYRLKGKSLFKEKYNLLDESGELVFQINVKRGFLVTIKGGMIEPTPLFDSIKEQFLMCCTALLMIKHNIRRKAVSAV